MKFKPENLRDIHLTMTAKAIQTGKSVSVTIFIDEPWDLNYDKDTEFRAKGYLYITKPNGTLECHMLSEYKNKVTQKIKSDFARNVEGLEIYELQRLEVTGFSYEENYIKTFRDLSKAIGIKLVTVSAKIPLNLKANFDQLTSSEQKTNSEVIRGLIEAYVLEGITKNAKVLMYQKPHSS